MRPLLLYLCVSLALPAAGHAEPEKRLALIIAPSDYGDARIDMPFLKEDCRAVGHALQESEAYLVQYWGDGFLRPGPNARKTSESLIAWMSEMIDTKEHWEQVLVYYAGHGIHRAKVKKSYLVLYGPVRDDGTTPNTWVDPEEIERLIHGSGARSLLVVDCCTAGGFTSALAEEWLQRRDAPGSFLHVYASCLSKELGFSRSGAQIDQLLRGPRDEALRIGHPCTGCTHSAFTYFLSNGLKNRSADGVGWVASAGGRGRVIRGAKDLGVDLTELSSYVGAAMELGRGAWPFEPQHPTVVSISGGGTFYILPPGKLADLIEESLARLRRSIPGASYSFTTEDFFDPTAWGVADFEALEGVLGQRFDRSQILFVDLIEDESSTIVEVRLGRKTSSVGARFQRGGDGVWRELN